MFRDRVAELMRDGGCRRVVEETSSKQKVFCLIVALPSIIPIPHDLKLDARCKETTS